jgi:hypothetical protein
MDPARRAVRTREDGTVEDRSLSALPALLNQAHKALELSKDGSPAVNITLVRVLSLPRNAGRPDAPRPPCNRAEDDRSASGD